MAAVKESRARLVWKRRRRMTSEGYYAESRCGRYRVYDSALGGYSATVLASGIWRALERRKDGAILWHRKRSLAIQACERHAKK